MIPLKIQPFRERLSENVHATIQILIVGGFEFTVFQFERMARETMDVCLRVLKEQCQEQRIHIPYYLSDLLRSHFFRQPFLKIAVYAYLTDTYVPRFERLKRSILLYCGSSDFLGLVFFACIFSFFLVE